MANLTPGILGVVVVIWHLEGSVLSDQTAVCAPVCEGGTCPVKIDPIDFEECACRMLGDRKRNKNNLTITHLQSHVEILLPKGFTPGGDAMLFAPAIREGDQPICYNIGVGNSTDTSRIKLECSNFAGISFNDTIVLGKHRKFAGRKLEFQEVPRTTGECNCWSPSTVKVQTTGNGTLTVEWQPFYWRHDVRILVQEESSKKTKDDAKIPNFQLCGRRMQNITFTDFEPGTYVAMVGVVGCDCKTHSDPITIDRLTVQKPGIRAITTSPTTKEPQVSMTIVVVVVGTLTFISLLALGLTLMVRRYRQAYERVDQHNRFEDALIIRQAGPHIDSRYRPATRNADYKVADTEIRAVAEISSHLTELFQGSGVTVTTKFRPEYEINDQLELYVSLEDASNLPQHGTPVFNRRLEVGVDHSVDPRDLPLVVSVQQDCPHSAFREDVQGGQGALLTIRETIQKLMPGFDFRAAEIADLANCVNEELGKMKDSIRNILLISGNGHKHHVNACKQLCTILEALGKTVNYVLDDSHREELRADGPLTWITRHLQASDLVIIVGSEYLFQLMDRYKRGVGCAELCGYLGNCAPIALTQLAKNHQRPRVAYVSFGYESESIETIEDISGVTGNMRYDLVGTSGVRGQGRYSALKIFLSRLSSEDSLVQRACEQSDIFHTHVRAMKTFLTKNKDWLKEKFSSKDTLHTNSSCSLSSSGQVTNYELETCL